VAATDLLAFDFPLMAWNVAFHAVWKLNSDGHSSLSLAAALDW
jgi:hypothetical protein